MVADCCSEAGKLLVSMLLSTCGLGLKCGEFDRSTKMRESFYRYYSIALAALRIMFYSSSESY